MIVAVIDGQGGGIGKAIVEKLRAAFNSEIEIIALGTNAMATSLMLRAGADAGASGENAILVNVPKANIIIGSIGIVVANSMLGELTPVMAKAIGESPGKKLLIPFNRCNIQVVGVSGNAIPNYVDLVIQEVRSHINKFRGEDNE